LYGVNENATLIVSNVGYDEQFFKIKGKNQIAISLKQHTTSLLDVVVNKGYYSTTQRLNTGNVSVVTAKEIEDQPVTDPILALEGRVPGLYIQQTSGMPGSYSTILLRGKNSIANGNDPLYVIDGVPFSSTSLTSNVIGGGAVGFAGTTVNYGGGLSPFNALNPDDIEKIEVLKDADATAIYGSRGANGVVLITTKKGKAGNTKVDIDLSHGNGKVTRMMDMMNTPEYLQVRHQAIANDGLTVGPNDYDLNGVWDTTRNTNWQKVLIGNTSQLTNIQSSVSGGSENTQFYIGGGYSRQTTVFPGDFRDIKGSLNFNLTHSSVNKKFQIQLSGGYVNDNNNLPQQDFTSTALQYAPDAPALYNADGSLNWQPVGGRATWSNPLSSTLITASAITKNLMSNLNLSYQVLPGLFIKGNFGYTDNRMVQTNQIPASSYPPPENDLGIYRSNNFGNTEFETWILEPQVIYERKISKGRLNFLAGTTFEQDTQDETASVSSGYSSDALISNPLNASTLRLIGNQANLYRYNAVFGRLGYTWDEKYLINLTARRDGSSRFGPGNQWGNFGAIGAGWIFSKEKFVENILSWLSFGKLRASYGTTGNDKIGDYQYLSAYSSDFFSYQGNSGLFPTNIPNPDYGWEVNKKLEIGLELGFLKDRMNITSVFYRNRCSDQLVGYTLPSLAGFTSVEANLPAVVQNTGWEFTINTTNIQSKDFRWTTSFNLTIPENKLIAFPNLDGSSYANTYEIGQSIYIQKAFTVQGVDLATGVYQFYDANGKPTVNPAYPTDLQPTKSITQKFYGGLGNSLSYEGFRMDIFFQFVSQTGYNYWYNNIYDYVGRFNVNAPTAILGKTWQNPGDISQYGVLSTESASNPNFDLAYNSNFGISNTSFVRLKNLALSYTLPAAWQKAMHMQYTRIYIQAQNLLTFTNYFGLDPESGSSGLPPVRMIALGIHATF
jgi:TonB-linked SusC/RagA family outer membrane protein